MPGKIVCVRFGEGELEGLDQLVSDMNTTRSDAIRRAVGLTLMRSTEIRLDRSAALDKDDALEYDQEVLGDEHQDQGGVGRSAPPSTTSGRSEPGAEPPPSVPGLPSLNTASCGESIPEYGIEPDVVVPFKACLNVQSWKGVQGSAAEPAPVFTAEGTITPAVLSPFDSAADQSGLPPPTVTVVATAAETTSEEWDKWINKVMEGKE